MQYSCFVNIFSLGLKTALKEIRAAQGDDKVVSLLTGDFLSPYLLSSVDRGQGMMDALAGTPIDILTWGNHGKLVEIGWSNVVGKGLNSQACLILTFFLSSVAILPPLQRPISTTRRFASMPKRGLESGSTATCKITTPCNTSNRTKSLK